MPATHFLHSFCPPSFWNRPCVHGLHCFWFVAVMQMHVYTGVKIKFEKILWGMRMPRSDCSWQGGQTYRLRGCREDKPSIPPRHRDWRICLLGIACTLTCFPCPEEMMIWDLLIFLMRVKHRGALRGEKCVRTRETSIRHWEWVNDIGCSFLAVGQAETYT